MKKRKKLKKFSLLPKSDRNIISLNVVCRLTEYDTESVTKDYNQPGFLLKKQFKSLCQIYIYKFIPP